MAKAAVLVCVMVVGWTWTLQGVPVAMEEGGDGVGEALEEGAPMDVNGTMAPVEVRTTEVALTETWTPAPHLNGTEMCGLDPERGMCKARLRRYFYNATSASCEMFFYGGCGGNQNNFRTEEKCLESCGKQAEPTHAPLVTEATP